MDVVLLSIVIYICLLWAYYNLDHEGMYTNFEKLANLLKSNKP